MKLWYANTTPLLYVGYRIKVLRPPVERKNWGQYPVPNPRKEIKMEKVQEFCIGKTISNITAYSYKSVITFTDGTTIEFLYSADFDMCGDYNGLSVIIEAKDSDGLLVIDEVFED
jgi:hypothetical protein